MHHEAGVRTVAAGGLPSQGPMQTPSGSRGAQSYTSDNLDTDIAMAKEINATAGNFLPERQEDVWISYLSFNLRDQVRRGESTPLQFVYEAANCRIFYTKDTVYNFEKLWRYAANATWTKPELCVQGSTGFASNGSSSDISGPPAGSPSVNSDIIYNMTAILELSGAIHEAHLGLSTQQFDRTPDKKSQVGQGCNPADRNCFDGQECQKISTCNQTQHQCVLPCDSRSKCDCIWNRLNNADPVKHTKAFLSGYCAVPKKCGTMRGYYDPHGPLLVR